MVQNGRPHFGNPKTSIRCYSSLRRQCYKILSHIFTPGPTKILSHIFTPGPTKILSHIFTPGPTKSPLISLLQGPPSLLSYLYSRAHQVSSLFWTLNFISNLFQLQITFQERRKFF